MPVKKSQPNMLLVVTPVLPQSVSHKPSLVPPTQHCSPPGTSHWLSSVHLPTMKFSELLLVPALLITLNGPVSAPVGTSVLILPLLPGFQLVEAVVVDWTTLKNSVAATPPQAPKRSPISRTAWS